jgi:hypothetical protein
MILKLILITKDLKIKMKKGVKSNLNQQEIYLKKGK